MFRNTDEFEYEYRGCDLIFGRGCVDRLDEYLAERDLDRAMIVCGSNVGGNDELMNPVEDGLGDRLAGVFDRTTPAKQAETTFEVIDAMGEVEADVLVGIGGGSSLDVARQASVLAPGGRSLSDFRDEARDGGIRPPDSDGDRPPVIVVPTTFAGADVSSGGSVEILSAGESPTEQPVSVSGSAMPIADFADPSLFETTPVSALSGSAMNGFDKGIETPYARDANPVSDATAVHGIRLLSDALPQVAGDAGSADAEVMNRAVVGSLLVQLDRKVSIIHAFGHGFARRYDVQQGAVHAVVAPHVLRYLFAKVDANRAVLANGFGINSADHSATELADLVADAVSEVRDSLDVPTRLRDLPKTRREELSAVAEFIVDDSPMTRAPTGLSPSTAEIEGVLSAAW